MCLALPSVGRSQLKVHYMMVMAVCDAKERGGGIISEILCFPLFRRGIAPSGSYGVRRGLVLPNNVKKEIKNLFRLQYLFY